MNPAPVTTQIRTDGHKLAGLDHLRALAITFVFFYHYRLFGHPDWEGKICGFGWTGVDLFFVLSGFLIAGQLFARIASGRAILYKEYFLKRVFRIQSFSSIPAWLLAETFSFASNAFTGQVEVQTSLEFTVSEITRSSSSLIIFFITKISNKKSGQQSHKYVKYRFKVI